MQKAAEGVGNAAKAPKQALEGEYGKAFKSAASAVGYYYGVPEKATYTGFDALEAAGVLDETKERKRR